MSNVLIIGGYGMSLNAMSNDSRVDDGSAYWALANPLRAAGHKVRTRECIENSGTEDEVSSADVLWADVIVSYSYGTASVKKIWHDHVEKFATARKRYALWVIVAGVPDFWMQQYYGTLWRKPPFMDRAVCFDVKDVPASCTLQNSQNGVPLHLFKDWAESTYDFNVDCGELFPAFMPPGDKHKAIKESPSVLAAIAQLILAIPAAPDLSGLTPPVPVPNPPSVPAAHDAAGAHAGAMGGAA